MTFPCVRFVLTSSMLLIAAACSEKPKEQPPEEAKTRPAQAPPPPTKTEPAQTPKPEAAPVVKNVVTLGQAVQHDAEQYQVPVALIYAVMEASSSFNPKVVEGDRVGLMLVSPAMVQETGVSAADAAKLDLTDVATNVEMAVRVLRTHANRLSGDMTKMVSAYRGGAGATDDRLADPKIAEWTRAVLARYAVFKSTVPPQSSTISASVAWSPTAGGPDKSATQSLPEAAAVRPEPKFNVTAARLSEEYEANPTVMERKYEGVRLRVKGTIEQFVGFSNDTVSLGGGSEMVTAEFSDDSLTRLRKGMRIVVVCDELAAGSTAVMLSKCVTEEPPPPGANPPAATESTPRTYKSCLAMCRRMNDPNSPKPQGKMKKWFDVGYEAFKECAESARANGEVGVGNRCDAESDKSCARECQRG